MTSLETYFKNSQPLDQYIEDMTENQENVLSIYNSFSIPQDDERLEKIKSLPYSKVLIITEDWCGDAMMNLPILKHISEALHFEVRVFHRDENTDLIDQYLTNGTARSIPIFVFLTDDFEQQTVWGRRSTHVENFVYETRSKPQATDAPTFYDKPAETHAISSNRNKTVTQMWKYVYN